MKATVGVLTNVPSPYQVELFDAITERGRLDLRVWYCADRDTRRLWERLPKAHWHRIGSGRRIETPREHWYLDPRPALELLRWSPDLAVFSVYPMPTVQLGMWCASLARLPWVYWGEAVASGGNASLRRIGRRLALLPVRRWAAGFFAVGQKAVDNFRAVLCPDRPILKVPYFSDLTRFQTADDSVTDGCETRFLFVGSFIHRKGVDLLAHAFSKLVESLRNVRLLVAGDGDTRQLFDEHLSAAASERVVRCGFVPWDRLPELYRRGDYLVMPSRYDGWGLVIPEAMASGLPVLGSIDAGATLDLVRDGITGWRVKSGDPHALCAAMLEAATLPRGRRLQMKQDCVIRARRYDAAVGARVFERAVGLVLRAAARPNASWPAPKSSTDRRRLSGRKTNAKMRDIARKPYVVYWNNIPSPYMVERFNAVADRGTFEFEAWFNERTEPGRSWDVNELDWRFPYRYLPTTRLFGLALHWPLPLLGRRPDVLVSLYAEPAFVVGWGLAKLRGAKTGFRVLRTYDRWVSRHPVKDAMKRFLFSHADAIETPGEEGKQFALRYGARAERIFFARHTVDVPHFEAGSASARMRRVASREVMGLKGTTFVYVGRLWWGKGINYLLEAFETVQRHSTHEVSLLLVGDGPNEAELRQSCAERGIRNVVFAGFKQKPELPRYYALADVFVFPTLGDPYGLVVDEAMACSLPVISTSAAGEIRDRVENGVNGYIVPPEDSAALATKMLELAEDPALRGQMGGRSGERIKGRTPDLWAEHFERIVQALVTRRS